MQEPDVNLPYTLAPAQEQFIAAIVGGATMQAAAEAASIHRNTISYWRRTSLHFRDALCHAQYDKAVFLREQAENHVTEAFAALHAILTDQDASAGARVTAAKYIIEKASTPPPPKPEVIHQVENYFSHLQANATPAQSPIPDAAPASTVIPKSEIMHSFAQSRPTQTVSSAPKNRPQRTLSLWQQLEIQAMLPRKDELSGGRLNYGTSLVSRNRTQISNWVRFAKNKKHPRSSFFHAHARLSYSCPHLIGT